MMDHNFQGQIQTWKIRALNNDASNELKSRMQNLYYSI